MTDVGKVRARKPGRPRKYGRGRIKAAVRFTPNRYAELRAAADVEGRSVSEEIEARVERSFVEKGLQDIRRELDQLTAERAGMWEELFEKAITRMAELQQAKALNEETIERAVARALARARLSIGEEEADK